MVVDSTIRPATDADVGAITRIIDDAYAIYVPRMELEPAPMLADWPTLIREADVRVATIDGEVVGVVVLRQEAGHVEVGSVGVATEAQGRGVGRALLELPEQLARDTGRAEVRLFTHEVMTENLDLYTRNGYVETARATTDGYRRVHLSKRIV